MSLQTDASRSVIDPDSRAAIKRKRLERKAMKKKHKQNTSAKHKQHDAIKAEKRKLANRIPNRVRYCHVNFFLRKSFVCGYPIQLLGMGNPMKEMVEVSHAASNVFEGVKTLVDPEHKAGYMEISLYDHILQNRRILCVVPGDGIRPTTGAFIAMSTNWTVISVDPEMGKGLDAYDDASIKRHYGVQADNLMCIRDKGEDVDYDQFEYDYVFLVHVHSHANFKTMWDKFENVTGYTLPCCGHVCHKLVGKEHKKYLFGSGVIGQEDYTGPDVWYMYRKGELLKEKPSES